MYSKLTVEVVDTNTIIGYFDDNQNEFSCTKVEKIELLLHTKGGGIVTIQLINSNIRREE